MPRYRVTRRYYSEHNGRRFGPYKAGNEVELDERDAAWLERDCPGTLEPVGGKPSRTEWKAPEAPLSTSEKSSMVEAPKRRGRKPKEA